MILSNKCSTNPECHTNRGASLFIFIYAEGVGSLIPLWGVVIDVCDNHCDEGVGSLWNNGRWEDEARDIKWVLKNQITFWPLVSM